jgi:hypothetical protein
VVIYSPESRSFSSSLENLEWETRFRILVTDPRKDTDLPNLPSPNDIRRSGVWVRAEAGAVSKLILDVGAFRLGVGMGGGWSPLLEGG